MTIQRYLFTDVAGEHYRLISEEYCLIDSDIAEWQILQTDSLENAQAIVAYFRIHQNEHVRFIPRPEPVAEQTCGRCLGFGEYDATSEFEHGIVYEKCDECQGTGFVPVDQEEGTRAG